MSRNFRFIISPCGTSYEIFYSSLRKSLHFPHLFHVLIILFFSLALKTAILISSGQSSATYNPLSCLILAHSLLCPTLNQKIIFTVVVLHLKPFLGKNSPFPKQTMKSDCNNHRAMFVPDLKLISS